MRNKIALRFLLLIIAAFVEFGCSAHRLQVGVDVDDEQKFNSKRFEAKLDGTARIEIRSADKSVVCGNKDKVWLKRIEIKSKEATIFKSNNSCLEQGRLLRADFKDKIKAGSYRVQLLVDPKKSIPNANFVVLFKPDQPEKYSGSNKTFQGAEILKEGPNEAIVNPGAGNATDWWRLDSAELSLYSIIFETNPERTDSLAQIYRIENGSLIPVKTLRSGQTVNSSFEGAYMIKVFGPQYGRTSQYSLLVQKMGKASGGEKNGLSTQQDLKISDAYPIDNNLSAIIVAAGTQKGIEIGLTLKVMDRSSSASVGICQIVSASETESECRIKKYLEAGIPLKARRNL